MNGNFFEHEEFGNVCRAVIQCDGPMLKKLVEDSAWVTKITWFEERPLFKTFQESVEDFRVDLLGEIRSPADNGPTVCIIDSGVTPKNPFLNPVGARIS